MTPQIIYLALVFTGLMYKSYKHGKPMDDVHNVWYSLISQAIVLALLYWGGFFNCFKP